MKYFLLATFVLFSLFTFSQKTQSAYIEIRGNVDLLGNINLNNVIKPKKPIKLDSLVDYSLINQILNLREPIKVINKLSEYGWTLVTVTQVSSDKENRPNIPFMLYYFRKDFDLQ